MKERVASIGMGRKAVSQQTALGACPVRWRWKAVCPSYPRGIAAPGSQAEIFPEAIDLVHPLVQNRHDADVAVREPPPIDEVPFIAEEVAVDVEFGRNGPR